MLRGGDDFNTVPGIAAMKLDIRYTEELQPAELLERMRNVNELSVETAETVARDADIELSEVTDSADDIVDCTGLDYAEAFAKEMNAEVDISDLPDVLIWIDDDTPAMHTDSSNEYVQRLRQTVESTTDGEAVVERELGASDMAFFSGNGVPCVVFGPCGDNLHEPGEYLEVDSLKPVYRTLRAFVTDERETTSDE